jgi:hypothetical protein
MAPIPGGDVVFQDEKQGCWLLAGDGAEQRPRLARQLRLFGRDAWRAFRRSALAFWVRLKNSSPRRG